MSLPYAVRLVCLCLAVFYLAQLTVAATVAALSSRALARAARMPARSGARFLLFLRLLPSALAAFIVLGLCAPSYLWLEPDAAAEQVGVLCLAAAGLGLVVCATAWARAARAGIRSARFLRTCRSAAESEAPLLMLAGVLRPRLVVSRGVRRALSPEQLEAALRHERAHGASRDNLKRLLILLTPDAIPGVRVLRRLERGWNRLAEWAADDVAAGGSAERGLALATALLRVARMGHPAAAIPLATSLLADDDDLTMRVERLLRGPTATDAVPVRSAVPAIAIGTVVATLGIPAALPAVHSLLEALAH